MKNPYERLPEIALDNNLINNLSKKLIPVIKESSIPGTADGLQEDDLLDAFREFIKFNRDAANKRNSTNLNPYTNWLIIQISRKRIYIDEVDEIFDKLALFDTLKNMNYVEDINDYNIKDINELIREYKDKLVNTEKIKQELLISGEATLFYKNNNIIIIIPHTFRASQAFGSKYWCTVRYKTDFIEYNRRGRFYYLIDKQNKECYAFVFEIAEFRDKNNNNIYPYLLINKYPILKRIFKGYLGFDLKAKEKIGLKPANKYNIVYPVYRYFHKPSMQLQLAVFAASVRSIMLQTKDAYDKHKELINMAKIYNGGELHENIIDYLKKIEKNLKLKEDFLLGKS